MQSGVEPPHSKEFPMADPRIRLIERICRLSTDKLPRVESLLNELEQKALLPPTASPDWPHAPVHRVSENGTFIITASTIDKDHFFRGADRLTLLESELLATARHYEITIEAWAVFSNHYHLVVHVNSEVNQIPQFVSQVHTKSAAAINLIDGTDRRHVWFNYWDTRLTFEKSYFARLNYVHQNPVKHGLVHRAADYRWCSAAWFEKTATTAQVKSVYSFKIDRVNVEDDFDPLLP
jgi:putative transposase